MAIWLDVEDLFHYAANNGRPSGIQRLSFEIYRELDALLGDQVHFCRHDTLRGTLRTVSWTAMLTMFEPMLAPAPAQPATRAPGPPSASRAALRRMALRIPLALREPLLLSAAAQRMAVRQGLRAVAAIPAAFRRPARAEADDPGFASLDIRQAARPGDSFVVLGSPWFHPDYAGFIGGIARQHGLRTALLVYDLIPLVRPEWCDRALVAAFSTWFGGFIRIVDHVFSISGATARDIESWATRQAVRLPGPIVTLPIGTGFGGPAPLPSPGLPAGLRPGGYILVVSTIEARKNHMLAFRVWRRMIDTLPPDQVPTLVFAGKIGWLVADLMQQLENCRFLGDKIVLVSNPGDADLAALYLGCRATLFPSLYEGWGLPVSESLAFGKLCIASNRTSLPEAGGQLCLYFDPEDADDAYAVIHAACTDDALLARHEAAIAAGFRPVPWSETAAALVAGLRQTT